MSRNDLNERCEAILDYTLDCGSVHVFFKKGRFTTMLDSDQNLAREIEFAGPGYMGRYDIGCDARWLMSDMRDQLRCVR